MAIDLQNIDSSKICLALRDEAAMTFAKQNLSRSYANHFPQQQIEVKKLLAATLDELVNSQSLGVSKTRLEQAVETVRQNFFNNDSSGDWFKSYYLLYKSQIKPKKDFERIEPFIKGKRVLDFGSGRGYLFSHQDKARFKAVCTDVEDYRDENSNGIHFVKMTSPVKIPLEDDSIDTAVVIAVLHHIDKANILSAIQELARVAKRLIVIEDIDDIDGISINSGQLKLDPITESFLSLSKTSRHHANIITDFFGNVVVQGYVKLNLPFLFNSALFWQEAFAVAGFVNCQTKILGFSRHNLHDFFKVLLVLDKET